MNIYYEFPKNFHINKPSVLTIGTFDGIHIAHQTILKKMVAKAIELNGETIVITFKNNPKNIIVPNNQIYLLSSLEEKIEVFKKFNIHHLIIIENDVDFFNINALEFIELYLCSILKMNTIFMGFNHCFGKNRLGNFELMQKYATTFNFNIERIEEIFYETEIISSTLIRKYINEQNMEKVSYLLGKPYKLIGLVCEGQKIGRTLGFPTANLQLNDPWKLIPANGVYAVSIQFENKDMVYFGMMNIGFRPTFNGVSRNIEVHIFNFNADIYGQILIVSIFTYIRNEIKFNGVENLKIQLNEDKKTIQNYFNL